MSAFPLNLATKEAVLQFLSADGCYVSLNAITLRRANYEGVRAGNYQLLAYVSPSAVEELKDDPRVSVKLIQDEGSSLTQAMFMAGDELVERLVIEVPPNAVLS